MANSENLKPAIRTSEEAREKGKNGGKKSGEARRKKRKIKDFFNSFLELEAPAVVKEQLINVFPELAEEELTCKAITVLAQLKKAFEGDSKAFETMIAIIGEKPAEKLETLNSNITVTDNKTIETVMNKLKDL